MMRNYKLGVAVLIGLVLAATGAWAAPAGEEAAAAADKPMVTDPTTGMQVTAPEYGGTLTQAYNLFGPNTDPSIAGPWAGFMISGVNERLVLGDWGLPRDEFSFTGWYVPNSVLRGNLAASWTQPDDRTLIVKIKPDIHWHDKAPMNGRELTAEDVAWTYRRHSGLLEFEPEYTQLVFGLPWESIEATDRYTVVFKLTEPRLTMARAIFADNGAWILPREVIEQRGDYTDWRNVVGTGPFMLTEHVEGVSLTRTRNPNYHGFDEKYSENRLPYVDELKGLFMAEEATRLAAMRTGQIDMIHSYGGGVQVKQLEVVNALLRTNPDIQVGPYFIRAFAVSGLNIRKPPFDDIRVRQAMQMALDRDAIIDSYYGGYAQRDPSGYIGNASGPAHTPFDEWPQELRDAYRFNPEKAEQLLDEAGYQRGVDGVRFEVTYDHREAIDLGYVEIASGYWKEIGVEVEINLMETTAWVNRRVEGLYEMITGDQAFDQEFSTIFGWYRRIVEREKHNNNDYLGGVPDPTLTRLYHAFNATTEESERIRIAKEFDLHALSQHFQVYGFKYPRYQLAQPWVKGWNGETPLNAANEMAQIFARLWLDRDLKAEMGF